MLENETKPEMHIFKAPKKPSRIRLLLQNWLIPAIILILIAGACAYRWEVTTTKNTDAIVVKWKLDRWTGDRWMEIYRGIAFDEKPINGSLRSRVRATNIMKVVAGVDIAWLLYALSGKKREGF